MGLSSIEVCFERIAAALERIADERLPLSSPPLDSTPAALPDHAASVAPAAAAIPSATYAEAQAAVIGYIGAHGHEAGKALLASFHAKYVKDLAPEHYGALVAKTRESA